MLYIKAIRRIHVPLRYRPNVKHLKIRGINEIISMPF